MEFPVRTAWSNYTLHDPGPTRTYQNKGVLIPKNIHFAKTNMGKSERKQGQGQGYLCRV